MISALELALAIILVGVVVWVGDAIAGGIEGALGEKKMTARAFACQPGLQGRAHPSI